MKRLKVVLDTNVLVSGIFWKGNSNELLEKCRDGEMQLIISWDILFELKKIIEREEKFRTKYEDVRKEIDIISTISEIIEPEIKVNVIEDIEDNRILECAVTGNVDYIVSGDNDLLKLKEYEGIKIITPARMSKTLFS